MLWRNSIMLCLVFLSSPVFAQENEYLHQLVQQARELRLAERSEWLNLLHFKPYALLPGGRSLADDDAFFNSPEGKTNPAAELESTLAAFFSDLQETDKQQNPQCSFIARYQWLKNELKFDSSLLPERFCKQFHAWRDRLNPHEVTLVFPDSYINNPISMYGHTLLRIDAIDQDEKTRLLASTISYSIDSDEAFGLIYTVKGLTGGYPGAYTIFPYYEQVHEYNDIENRDVWEYRLTLTAPEIDRLLEHLWEVGPIRFDYYFFDENCSYNLLSLLDVARPRLNLTDRFRWWAIPLDAVRAVVEQPGLLRDVTFRPSNATFIKERMSQLDTQQQALAKDLSEGRLQVEGEKFQLATPQEQAQLLELSYDYLSYQRARNGDTPEVRKRSRNLLLARSRLDVADMTPKITPPEIRPDQGHNTSRVGVALGLRDDLYYQEIAMRPSYHDQNDPEGGYNHGAQIQYFNLILRHYENTGGIRVEEFTPVDIYSLTPTNDYFKSVSWKTRAGWKRKRFSGDVEPLVAYLNGGIGRAWEIALRESSVIAYAFVDGDMEESSKYSRHYAVGLGPALGMKGDVSEMWRINAYGRVQRFGLGELHTTAELTLVQRFSIGAQSALRVELARKREFDTLWTDTKIIWQRFF